MSRSSASRGPARIALVGASTPVGTRLRDALVHNGIPGNRVDLFGTSQGEALISEYDGEARLVQEPDLAEISDHDLVFLCERAPALEAIVDASSRNTVVIDLIGALPREVEPPLVHMDLNPEAAGRHDGFLEIPHPLAMVLGELLHPLERRLGIDEVVAVVLRPAADFGEQGIEELRAQTVSLLNFGDVPVATFGRQLAFNIIPQGRLGCGGPDLESTVAGQVARLLGSSQRRLTVRLLAAPLFYGHGVELRLRTRNGASVEAVREVLEHGGFIGQADSEEGVTPMDVADERATRVSELSADELGGFWLWAVAGGTGFRTAEQAIRLAGSLRDL